MNGTQFISDQMNVNSMQFSVPFLNFAIYFGHFFKKRSKVFFIHIGPPQVKCRLLISSIFDAMNFQYFLENLNFFQNYWVYEVFLLICLVGYEMNIFSSVPIQFMNVNRTKITLYQRNVNGAYVMKKRNVQCSVYDIHYFGLFSFFQCAIVYFFVLTVSKNVWEKFYL